MGTRQPEQPPMWVATSDLPSSPGHPFYSRLNAMLEAERFDEFAEDRCRQFYAPVMGRPSLEPGRYFRLLLVATSKGSIRNAALPGELQIRWGSPVRAARHRGGAA